MMYSVNGCDHLKRKFDSRYLHAISNHVDKAVHMDMM